MEQRPCYSVYALAHTDHSALPFNNHGRTLRVVVRMNIETKTLWVRFANHHGKTPLTVGAASLALCDDAGVLQADTLVPVTVGGRLAFRLAPGEGVQSDAVSLSVKCGQYLALNLYYPDKEKVTSGNRLGTMALRSKPGNHSVDLSLPAPGLASRFAKTMMASGLTVQTTTVCDILAQSEEPHRVVACFGDSITQHSNWTGPLQRRLEKEYPGQVSLCNLGIGGNRLLHDAPEPVMGLYGLAGMKRFERDVLSLQGVHSCVLELGLNDIGLPGAEAPETELITLEEYKKGMETLCDLLHQKGIKAYGATLTPRTLQKPYGEEREELRKAINRWILEADCFDAVLDFDAVLRRDDGKPGMQEGFALPDGLHPSAYGGLWMAKSIDLSLFGGEAP